MGLVGRKPELEGLSGQREKLKLWFTLGAKVRPQEVMGLVGLGARAF